MANNRNIWIGVGALLVIIAGVILLINLSSDNEPTVTQVDTTENEDTEGTDVNDEPVEPTEADTTPEAPKTPQLSGDVTEKPIIASSFGLVTESPVPNGQTVSTSCTTAPNVDCLVQFTNQETEDVIQFEVKRSSDSGIAIWEWQAGDEIPSGTWVSSALAGDQQSTTEVIYVQ